MRPVVWRAFSPFFCGLGRLLPAHYQQSALRVNPNSVDTDATARSRSTRKRVVSRGPRVHFLEQNMGTHSHGRHHPRAARNGGNRWGEVRVRVPPAGRSRPLDRSIGGILESARGDARRRARGAPRLRPGSPPRRPPQQLRSFRVLDGRSIDEANPPRPVETGVRLGSVGFIRVISCAHTGRKGGFQPGSSGGRAKRGSAACARGNAETTGMP